MMTRWFLLAVLGLSFSFCTGAGDQPAEPESFKVICANLRNCVYKDGDDHWDQRRTICLEVLHAENADLMAFQEMNRLQRDDFLKEFPDFDAFGGLNYAVNGHPTNGILFRKSRFKELAAGAYALSDTPHIVGSASWGNKSRRLVNYLFLQDRVTGKIFRLTNTHLDHQNQDSREKSAVMLNEDAAAFPETLPQILTGDMNCDRLNAAMQILFQAGWQDSFLLATGKEEPGFTFHAFRGPEYENRNNRGKIDFILVRGPLKVTGAAVVDRPGATGRFPSDHYFVTARIEL